MQFSSLLLPILLSGASAMPQKRDAGLETRADHTPGWCGVHVAQTHAIGEVDWLITAEIFDAAQKSMGKMSGERVKGDSSVHMQSDSLKDALEIIPREDSVYFNYATVKWSAKDKPRCSLGKWDGATGAKLRQMDCGFTC